MAPIQEDLVGHRLASFRIDAKIGEGGMGIVYRAVDERLGRVVALKVLPAAIAHDENRRARFLREARLAAGITHPNVVTVYEVGEDEGRIFIAMELLEGKTLRQLMGGVPMPLHDALGIARGIASALVRAHERGVVHRDLKPDNVFVGADLVPKVLDFGLAKPFDTSEAPPSTPLELQATAPQLTRAGPVLGSPGYMSPEQATGGPVDPRTDMFSFGVVLYQMLTGARPFPGKSVVEILVATARDTPPAPRLVRPEIPVHLERLILRCLEKRPDARYASFTELRRELEERPPEPVDPLSATVSAGDRVADEVRQVAVAARSLSGAGSVLSTPVVSVPTPVRGRRALTALGLVVVLIGVGVAITRVPRGPSAPPPLEAGPPPGAPTVITDLPAPRSPSPEAIVEYRAGLQALRDDSFGQARSHFMRATSLDDSMAMAHLHAAMTLLTGDRTAERREHYAKAVSYRSELGDRDRGLLEALEPELGTAHEDRDEAFARLMQLSGRYPGDVEILDWLGLLRVGTAEGVTLADRAIALDPRDAQALETRGRSLGELGRLDEAHATLERCSATSPESSDCFIWLATIDSAEGRCEDAERWLRRGLDRDPGFIRTIPAAMFGAGRRPEAVREVMRQAADALPEADRRSGSLWSSASLAAVTGDFAQAASLLAEYAGLVESNAKASLSSHLAIAELGMGLALEQGDEDAAFRAAWSFVSRADTWQSSATATQGIDDTVRLLRQSLRRGGLSRDEFEQRRAAWIARRRTSGASRSLTWVYGYAVAVVTPDEAHAALDVLPGYAPLTWFPTRAGVPDAEIGRVYLLAGETDEAVAHLSRAVASCDVLMHPFAHARAELDLGRALESRGDASAACAPYARLMARWGTAQPRSASAEKARTRMKALGCRD